MTSNSKKWAQAIMSASLLAAALTSTGCQVVEGGQLLPSPYYLDDDVQYYAPGPEFKLSREAAAQKAYNAEQRLQDLGGGGGIP